MKHHIVMTIGLCLTTPIAFAANPTEPGNFRAAVYSQTSAEIFWNRSTDDGYVQGYEIRRNNELLGVFDALSLYQDDLNPGVEYRYSIQAIDVDNNRSSTGSLSLTGGSYGNVGTTPTTALQPPNGLRADVYSTSAIELFWDRANTPGLRYEVRQDGSLLSSTDGTSYFISNLAGGQLYTFDVKAMDTKGYQSLPSTLSLNTTASIGDVDEPPLTDTPDNPGNPQDGPDAVQNVRLHIYSDNAAELVWDRPAEDSTTVSTQVYRNGDVLANSFGTSFYDGSRTIDSNQIYSLIAIDAQGQQSLPTTLGQFEDQQLQTGFGNAAYGNYGHMVIDGDTAVVPADRQSSTDHSATSGAVYIFTRNTSGLWKRTQKLQPVEGVNGFGLSVAINGNTLAVGQRFNSVSPSNRGRVTIYTRDSQGVWTVTQWIDVDAINGVYRFGDAIDIDGNQMMISANHDQDGDAVFTFTKDVSGQWTQQQKLEVFKNSAFGESITIDGDTAVIGDYLDDTNGWLGGAAYVFTRDESGKWNQTQKLVPDGTGDGQFFGTSVAYQDGTIVLGGSNSKSAIVFAKNGGGLWAQTQQLDVSFGDENLPIGSIGTHVAMDEGTLVVGVKGASLLGKYTGAVLVFKKYEGDWQQTEILASSNGAAWLQFGETVAIDGNSVLVGAYLPSEKISGTTGYVYTLPNF